MKSSQDFTATLLKAQSFSKIIFISDKYVFPPVKKCIYPYSAAAGTGHSTLLLCLYIMVSLRAVFQKAKIRWCELMTLSVGAATLSV
jgi:hypothetical protein